MTMPVGERDRMLAVPLCGPRVLARLESIGITRLRDLAHRDPHDVLLEVNIQASRPIRRPPMATEAMANLIAAAKELDSQ
jgi:hypothetical protein